MKYALMGAVAALATTAISSAAFAETLKLSHQWADGDVRHQVAQMVADDVAAGSTGVIVKHIARAVYAAVAGPVGYDDPATVLRWRPAACL